MSLSKIASTNSIAYNVRITDPEVMTFLLQEAGDDSERFEALIKRFMSSKRELLSTPVSQNSTEAVVPPCAPATQVVTPSVNRKRKATTPASRDFTEETVPEFIEKIINDYLVVTNDTTSQDFVDMSAIRGLFEQVLEEEYSITRGAKGIIAKLLKPTVVNPLVTDAIGVALEKSIKVKLDPMSFASIVPEGYTFEECADKDNMVMFKNVFLGVRLADGGSSATPAKPRAKKSTKDTAAEEPDNEPKDVFEFEP